MQDVCKEMPFNRDGIGHLDAESAPEDVFVSYALPKTKSVKQSQRISNRRPFSFALNFARGPSANDPAAQRSSQKV
jgi:hypothetical protein